MRVRGVNGGGDLGAVGPRAPIDVLLLDFAAERLKPSRHLRGDSTFVDRTGASSPALLGPTLGM
jgi:hypothetical protein